MTKSEYNKVSMLYQILADSFTKSNVDFNGFYKRYLLDSKIFTNDSRELLRKMQTIQVQDLLRPNALITTSYSKEWLTSKLVRIDDKYICTHLELGQILFFYLFDKLKSPVSEFINLLNELIRERYVGIDLHEKYIKISFDQFKSQYSRFKTITDFEYMYHFLAQTNSNIIHSNISLDIEIRTGEIEKITENLGLFDLSKLVL